MNRTPLTSDQLTQHVRLSIKFFSLITLFFYSSNILAQDHSWITIQARGNTGEETMKLVINDEVVHTWENISSNDNCMKKYKLYIYEPLTINSLKIESASSEEFPHAIQVDKIIIDGIEYQTESKQTLSYGSWTDATECEEGYKSSEWLSCPNAWFNFEAVQGVHIIGKNYEQENTATTSVSETLNDNNSELEISIYPNPVAETLNVKFKNQKPDQASLYLFDRSGALVKQEKLNNTSNQVNLTELHTGNYFFQITAANRNIEAGQILKI